MVKTFRVYGLPATKGSTVSFVGDTGKVITKADCKRLASWSTDVAWAAKAAGVKCLRKPTPVALTLTFAFLRPRSAPERASHTVKPDIDKLTRASLDALSSGVGYDDDSQVVSISAIKLYGLEAYTQIEIGAWTP